MAVVATSTADSLSLGKLGEALAPEHHGSPGLGLALDENENVSPGSRFAALLHAVLDQSVAFNFHYQSIVDLHRGGPVGYEGLVRFPGNLPLGPDRWLSLAERFNCRVALEDLVTRRAILSRSELPANCFLSINASPSYILSKQWDAVLANSGNLRRIVVELTENEPVNDYRPLLAKIAAIREAGGTVAVDDAGSGFSSLQHIMSLKPEFIKLDRVFINGCDKDHVKSALIEMVGKAAGRLDAWIIAEGVETEGELDEVIGLRVPLAQGYFLALPQPGMQPLEAEPAAAILKHIAIHRSAHTLHHSVEPCPDCTDATAARHLLHRDPELRAAVVTDSWGRPVELYERHPLVGIRQVPSIMRAQLATVANEALERALTRAPERCYDPLVAIDELGKFAGVVQIDRLVRRMLLES